AFDGKNKAIGSLFPPVSHGLLGRQPVKRRVDFHRWKLSAVEGELLPCRQAGRIKRSCPSLVNPATGSDEEPSHGSNIARVGKWVTLNGMKEPIGNGEIKLPTQPVESAKLVGLRYVTDEMPGFRRQKAGKGVCYLDSDGNVIRDRAHLRRIKSLVIPPAWTDVWICPISN